MQKIDRKASILIWAIFLSMTLIIAFTSINYQIRQNLLNNATIVDKIKINNEKIYQINQSIKNNVFTEIKLLNNEKIVFEGDNIINKGFKDNEEISLNILGNSASNITIKINEGGPLYYSNEKIEGLIIKDKTFNTIIGEINIKNLGGYADVIVTSENKFDNGIKKYKIVTIYGNKTILKETGEIIIN